MASTATAAAAARRTRALSFFTTDATTGRAWGNVTPVRAATSAQ
ncbi:hypothetical protein [Streptomyces albidoflavus]|nr:hypothetical protein [Streptomyces albidoflavus]